MLEPITDPAIPVATVHAAVRRYRVRLALMLALELGALVAAGFALGAVANPCARCGEP